jgi:hypothetical protein
LHGFDQTNLDQALLAGEPQVVAAGEHNFLVLGKIAGRPALYVGYVVEATPARTAELLPAGHIVRQLNLQNMQIVPLDTTVNIMRPHQLVVGGTTTITVLDTLMDAVRTCFLRRSLQNRRVLHAMTWEAIASIIAAGLWTGSTMAAELPEAGITRVCGLPVQELSGKSIDASTIESIAVRLSERLAHQLQLP